MTLPSSLNHFEETLPIKTIAALLPGLSAVATLSLPAAAESFNDQSPEPVANAPGVIQLMPPAVVAESDRFNDRDVDYIVASPTGSQPVVEKAIALNMHFNMK